MTTAVQRVLNQQFVSALEQLQASRCIWPLQELQEELKGEGEIKADEGETHAQQEAPKITDGAEMNGCPASLSASNDRATRAGDGTAATTITSTSTTTTGFHDPLSAHVIGDKTEGGNISNNTTAIAVAEATMTSTHGKPSTSEEKQGTVVLSIEAIKARTTSGSFRTPMDLVLAVKEVYMHI